MDFNKNIKIGEPLPIMAGVTRGLETAAAKNDRIVAVLEDLGHPALAWFKQNAPQRIVECGIAEANGAVVAGGLAAEGYIPYVTGMVFAAILRAYNQIRQSILVDRFNVKFISRDGAWGETGVSHNTIEGIAATRVMPNLVIVCPADIVEAEQAMVAISDYIGPVFYRQDNGPSPLQIFTPEYRFELGRAYFIREGRDATIIATGFMVSESIQALEILEKDGLDVGLLDMSTLKPLDEAAIIRAAETTGAIVTAENHSIIGGLGEGVAAVLAENYPVPLVRVGVEDEFSQSGKLTAERDELKEHFALSAEDIAVSVRECIEKKARSGNR